ncbi:flagellar FliJ protein [Acetitomaculum ruminis DSM 5522]|uniref:Flagellar FliJ protein n=1 Tax=Acetitomaculum ruminis DSM 5522 TaxID=1120918 RepID=A0A1I0ZI47_9FIRM|nr:flagellar export protein FliJ [Acetitomaculum ruminis]SFB25042.1 flagellar FliJ protein [Acetitomaculum ruminis DSM 5522]
MGRFIFKMQNILEIKIKLETQAKNAYAEAANRLSQEEEKRDALIKRRLDYEDEERELMTGKMNVIDIKSQKEAIRVMDELIKRQRAKVVLARKNLDLERIKLNQAMVERKTYEKLRERALEEYREEELARESKEIDELVSYKYGTKQL